MIHPEDLKFKKIGILGFGVEGRAVAQYLAGLKTPYDVFDQNPDLDLADFPGKQLLHEKFTGPDYLKKIGLYDYLFRSPGIKFFPEILDAQKNGAVLTSQIKYFFDNCPAKIIGVTGTKGKGTTATLIHRMLRAAGLRSFIGGNVGAEILGLLGQLTADDWVVLELSSFQLFDIERSPHLAVVLMVTAEHLDYHADVGEYVAAKNSITKYQGESDFAVVNCDFESSRQIGMLGTAKKYFVHTPPGSADFENGIIFDPVTNELKFIEDSQATVFARREEVLLPGVHNLQNVCAAAMAAKIIGIELTVIKQVLAEFPGLEHRLELVIERGGIKFYNDSFGTTPETCLAAVQAFDQDEILIVGGFDKKGDYAGLGRDLARQKNIKAAILIGQIAPQLQSALEQNNFSGKILNGAKDIGEVFSQVRSVAAPGDIVLLAPATSSFDWFKNYKDRGNQFKKLALEF